MAERFASEEVDLAAAMDGDADAFRQLTDRYTRELHVHCYRMLGSLCAGLNQHREVNERVIR